MTPSSVLVVKPSSLGDIVHTLPAVHYLKETFQEAEISWIVNTEWVPLLEKNTDLEKVIPFPRGEFSGPIGMLRFVLWCHGLSELKPDLILDFQGLFRAPGSHAVPGANRCSVCRIPEKQQGSAMTGKRSFARGSILSTVTWHWQDSRGLTPQDRFNFLFHPGRRFGRSYCRSVSPSCTRLREEPANA